MKRALLGILLFSLMLSLFLVGNVAAAETTAPYDLAASFASTYSRRDILSGGEGAAQKALSEALSARGYAVTEPSFRKVLSSDEGKDVVYEYANVIGFKDNGKGKTLLFGCYYGGYEPTDSLGVGDGASVALGVGTLLYVASALSDLSLDYDVAIAFWGGMELGVDLDLEKCGVDLSKVALYVNFDCVGAGSKDYLYADDVPRTQEKYFLSIAEEQGANLSAAPTYKKPAAFAVGDGAYSYLHLGILGANRCFLNEGVACVNFTSGAWDYESGLYRYPGKGEIEGTSLDTLAEIDKLNGGKESTSARLLAISKVVIAGVTDARLPEILDKAAKERTGADLDSRLAYYLITFIGIAGVFAFFLVLILKQGKDRRDVQWEPIVKPSEKSEDPFEEFRSEGETFSREEKSPEDEKDEDDIFRF